ncbi:uncharacterized protein HKW66_Vig0160890 [Vigna angularis]|uniref:Uncharacterized protein n=1 Tax=Phaseolus angularis TaxID=3914 RepID=A0A8T0JKU1_PHAAN|nr:uncharacterized protein HKW66_Vig0160890 [Vigna angularis]
MFCRATDAETLWSIISFRRIEIRYHISENYCQVLELIYAYRVSDDTLSVQWNPPQFHWPTTVMNNCMPGMCCLERTSYCQKLAFIGTLYFVGHMPGDFDVSLVEKLMNNEHEATRPLKCYNESEWKKHGQGDYLRGQRAIQSPATM